ncbi:MAG: monoamine oxidase [Candidatus Binataceae bacterium]|nr:monoamine oxidase [Candidatus Binataceae bacterium]
MVLSRRQFLTRFATVSGMGAALLSMQALGLASIAFAEPAPILPAKIGTGIHIVILGAGIAGLVTAYRLERAGFSVTLIEARRRTGGRNWTLRHGDKVEMIGESEQPVRFSPGLYFNAGPARIPSHHQGLLGYCKLLGVPLEVEVNFNDSALLQSDGSFNGQPIQERQAINDFRGRIAELLSKATNRGALDQELTADDKQRLIAFLRDYGDLSKDNLFQGTDRAGYKVPPGAYDQIGVRRDPLSLRDLLRDDELPDMMFDDLIEMQATMLEPVGGMDRVPAALHKAIRSPIRLGAEVSRIRQTAEKIEVVYRDRASGYSHKLSADYVVCTIPLPVLARIDTDFSAPVKQAIAGAKYDHAAKVAFESPRIWEAQQIYGGLSFGGSATGPVWYPSGGYQSPRGIILGAYVAGKPAQAFEALPISRQIEMARNAIDKLHPGHGVDLSGPVAVDWSKVPYNLGPWIHWTDSTSDKNAYRLLNQPEGRVYFSGAHLSQIPGWQEGAVLAAHRTIELIASRVGARTSTASSSSVSPKM